MDMFQRLFSLSLTWFVLLGGVAQRSVFVVAEGPQKTLVKVRFLVETTIVQTNAQEKLFLAGNIEALGKWKPNGVALQRTIEGKFQVELEIAEGTTIEFKVTRGSWDTVEVSGLSDARAKQIRKPSRSWLKVGKKLKLWCRR